MTEPVRPLEALIAKWRESAQWESESNMQYAQALDQCADELAALLQAAAPPAPTAESVIDVRPPQGWGGLRARVWNKFLDSGMTLHEADQFVGLISQTLLEAESAPAAPPERVSEGKEPMKGDGLIAQERQRQQMVEGWTDSHDDEHDNGEMVSAAIAYLTRVMQRRPPSTPPPVWPWEPKWWKFSDDAVRNLVKAGALIAAEIDRLERAARPAVEPREEPR